MYLGVKVNELLKLINAEAGWWTIFKFFFSE